MKAFIIVCIIFVLVFVLNPLRLFYPCGILQGDYVEYDGFYYTVPYIGSTDGRSINLTSARYPSARPDFYDVDCGCVKKVNKGQVYRAIFSEKELADRKKDEAWENGKSIDAFLYDLMILTFLTPVGWGVITLLIIGGIIAITNKTEQVLKKDYSRVQNKEEKFLEALAEEDDD